MIAARLRVGMVLWPLAGCAVIAHLGLGLLAVVELARLDWLPSEPYELTAVTVVAGSAGLALEGAARVAWPAARGNRALKRLIRSARAPVPDQLRAAAESLGVLDRIDVVGAGDRYAVTYGLWHPRILVSVNLVAVLDQAELAAVLVHERHHLRRRDPLRLFACRVVAGYGWFLPLLRWWARRLALRWELTADQAATASTGVAAVAGALLKLTDLPVPVAVAAAHGDLPDRIAALEGQPPARRTRVGWWLAGASLANLAGLSAAAICCAGLGVAMTGGMT
jgi:Zn-dependent protease with chaperone function